MFLREKTAQETEENIFIAQDTQKVPQRNQKTLITKDRITENLQDM